MQNWAPGQHGQSRVCTHVRGILGYTRVWAFPCSLLTVSNVPLEVPPALFCTLLDSPGCSQVCGVFASQRDCLDTMSSWPASNLTQPGGAVTSPGEALSIKHFPCGRVKKICSSWFRFVRERGSSVLLSCQARPHFLCQQGAHCLLHLLCRIICC